MYYFTVLLKFVFIALFLYFVPGHSRLRFCIKSTGTALPETLWEKKEPSCQPHSGKCHYNRETATSISTSACWVIFQSLCFTASESYHFTSLKKLNQSLMCSLGFRQEFPLSQTEKKIVCFFFCQMCHALFRLINHTSKAMQRLAVTLLQNDLICLMNYFMKHNWSLSDGAECGIAPCITITFSSQMYVIAVKSNIFV